MYTIGDFLIQIKNAYSAHKKSVNYPFSKTVLSIAKILEKEGYVKNVKLEKGSAKAALTNKKNAFDHIMMDLFYNNGVAPVSNVKLISRPSVHYYFNKAGLKKTSRGRGISILSTSHGIMTGKQAGKEGLGGELICQIY